MKYGERCAMCEQEKSAEISRLRAEVEELKESERGLQSMNDGLADWNSELRKQVETLKRPCSCLTHFVMNRKLEEKNHELRHEVEELKRSQRVLSTNERVINIERVMELVSSMEEGAVIRGGQHLMEERWGELRKELGLE
jgi:FtsZ-binding cell division protein ZapB